MKRLLKKPKNRRNDGQKRKLRIVRSLHFASLYIHSIIPLGYHRFLQPSQTSKSDVCWLIDLLKILILKL